jgi:hypothetical protein
MSEAQHGERKLRAQEFEQSLDAEIAHLENLTKSPTEVKGMTLRMATPEQTIDIGMELIKKAGLMILKFNGLPEAFKISLFDKLMKYIEKFKKLLEEYGNKMGVESFSIEVGFPWAVSISFTFKPKYRP